MRMNVIKLQAIVLLSYLCIVTVSCNDSAKKNHNSQALVDTTAAIEETTRKYENNDSTELFERKEYSINNVSIYSNESFEEFISFTFRNNSNEQITNVLFKQITHSLEDRFSPDKRKVKFRNQKVMLNPKDSIIIKLKINFDFLNVNKIRFASGRTISDMGKFGDLGNFIYNRNFTK